jgi:hypothetical protein
VEELGWRAVRIDSLGELHDALAIPALFLAQGLPHRDTL